MKSFLMQTGVQALIGAVIWTLIARDARKVREERGTTPAGISPFAWGALCGLTWVALIGYFMTRNRPLEARPTRERTLLKWWIVLAVGATVWSATDGAHHDTNNAAQHAILSATFVVCAVIAWSRDRVLQTTHAPLSEVHR